MCSTTLVSSKQVFIGSRMPISPPCACCPFICGYMSHLYLSLSSTAVSVAVIIWLAGVAGTCGQCLCIISGTGPLWGRLFPHCAPPWLGRSVCSCGLLECKPSVPLSNSPPTLIHDFCACIINFFFLCQKLMFTFSIKICDFNDKYVGSLANWTPLFTYHIFDIRIACLFFAYEW